MPFVRLWTRRHVLLAVLLLCALSSSGEEPAVRWTMLDITPHEDVADSHLLQMPGGATVLIDAGRMGDNPDGVLKQLKAHGITHIDLVVISHFHIDHYGALLDLPDAGITIGKVVVNVPDAASANPEMPWGCNLEHVRQTLDGLRDRGIPFTTAAIGDRIWEERTTSGAAVTLEVLSVYDGLHTPIGRTDVNDTSIILRLSVGPTRALFTGDLNHAMGAYLAQSSVDLAADVLKVPHHGTESVAPDSFFDRVGAKAALVPSPHKLWITVRSARIRNHFAERNIPVYVSGERGNVTVTLTEHGYGIETER